MFESIQSPGFQPIPGQKLNCQLHLIGHTWAPRAYQDRQTNRGLDFRGDQTQPLFEKYNLATFFLLLLLFFSFLNNPTLPKTITVNRSELTSIKKNKKTFFPVSLISLLWAQTPFKHFSFPQRKHCPPIVIPTVLFGVQQNVKSSSPFSFPFFSPSSPHVSAACRHTDRHPVRWELRGNHPAGITLKSAQSKHHQSKVVQLSLQKWKMDRTEVINESRKWGRTVSGTGEQITIVNS